MLDELKIDEILDTGKVDSRYGLVLAGARRARQINEYTATLGLNDSLGIPGPQVHTRSQHPLSIAIEELREDRLKVAFKETAEEEIEAPSRQLDDVPSDEAEQVAEEVADAPDANEGEIVGEEGSQGEGAA